MPIPEGEVWQARLGRGVGVVDLQDSPGLVMCGHGRIWLARERGLSVFPVRVVLGRLPPSSRMFRAIFVEEKADLSVLVLQLIGAPIVAASSRSPALLELILVTSADRAHRLAPGPGLKYLGALLQARNTGALAVLPAPLGNSVGPATTTSPQRVC